MTAQELDNYDEIQIRIYIIRKSLDYLYRMDDNKDVRTRIKEEEQELEEYKENYPEYFI